MMGFCATAATVAQKNIENNFSFMFEVSSTSEAAEPITSFKNPYLNNIGAISRNERRQVRNSWAVPSLINP